MDRRSHNSTSQSQTTKATTVTVAGQQDSTNSSPHSIPTTDISDNITRVTSTTSTTATTANVVSNIQHIPACTSSITNVRTNTSAIFLCSLFNRTGTVCSCLPGCLSSPASEYAPYSTDISTFCTVKPGLTLVHPDDAPFVRALPTSFICIHHFVSHGL